MKGFDLTPSEIAELRQAHRKERDKRAAYKINAVILLGSGWSLEQVSQALLLDEETLRNYVGRYKAGGVKKLLKSIYMGRTPLLTEAEKAWLSKHVDSKIYTSCNDIVWSLYEFSGKKLSQRSMRRLLNELGFSYKKTKVVPGKADPAAQQTFVDYYNTLKQTKNEEDVIYFCDSTHPTHNSESGYAWIKTGEEKPILSNSGRQRISINGALDIENMKVVGTKTVITDGKAIVGLLKKVDAQTRKKGEIHVIFDNARYNYSKVVKNYLKTSRIKIHFLPPYSPNLNPIERLWKFMKKEVVKNKYYPKFSDFERSISKFFQYFGRYRIHLRSMLTDNFRIVQSSST